VIRAYDPGWLTDAEYRVPGQGGLGKLLTTRARTAFAVLRKAGPRAQAAEPIQRLPAEGQFQLFSMQEGQEDQFPFGRDADGCPAKRWAWTDLGLTANTGKSRIA
jgi:hypothetical protein